MSTDFEFIPCDGGKERVEGAMFQGYDDPCQHTNSHEHFLHWLRIYYGREPTFEEYTGAMFESHDRAEARYYGARLAGLVAQVRKDDRLGEEIWATADSLIEPIKIKDTQPRKSYTEQQDDSASFF